MNSFRRHIQKKLSGYEPGVNDRSLHESWKRTEQLLDKKNRSRQRLDNFEPDVKDAEINEKWKAIIPYLPEEKKKRAGFYIPPGCFLPGLLVLAPLLFFAVYYFTGLNEKPIETKKHNGNGQSQGAVNLQHQKENAPTRVKIQIAPSPVLAKNSLNYPVDSASTWATGYNGSHANINRAAPVRSIDDLSHLQTNSLDAGIRTVDSICFLQPLSCYPDKLTLEPSLIHSVTAGDSVPVKKTSRFVVDVTAGAALAHNVVQYNDLQELYHDKTNVCLSVALNYQLKKRVWLGSQVCVSNNRCEYRSSDTKNMILSEVPLTMSTSTGSIDSLITYVPVNENYRLQSMFTCQAGVGPEVRLFNKNKFSLSVAMLLQLSMTQFRYSYSYQPSGDTLSYIKQSSSPALQNITTDSEPRSLSAVFLKTNLGIYPSLVIGYKVTPQLNVIAKPAAYFDVREIRPARISYRHYSFLLTAGIRLRL